MRLNRRGCAVLVIVLICAFAGLVWWLIQPKYRFATRAEVEAVVDKRLLEPLPDPQGAAARYGRLQKLWKEYKEVRQPLDSRSVEQNLAWALRANAENQDLTRKVADLYREGIVYNPERMVDADDFPQLSKLKGLVKCGSLAAEALAATGKLDAAMETLLLQARLVKAAYNSATNLIEELVAIATLAIVHNSTSKIVRAEVLSERQLTQLLDGLSPLDPNNTTGQRVIRGEFQMFPLRLLPRLGADLPTPKLPLLDADDHLVDPRALPPGQYDAIESAKMVSKTYGWLLDDLQKPYAGKDAALLAFAAEQTKGLPEENFKGLEGPERSAKELWYRFRMNNTPNSVGKMFFGDMVFSESLGALAKIKTEREALRGLIAAEIYRKRRGAWPASLQDLVSNRLLGSVPWDYLGNTPLHWDAKRELLWSVGSDLKNDGGAIGMNFAGKAADYGYRLSKFSLIKPAKNYTQNVPSSGGAPLFQR